MYHRSGKRTLLNGKPYGTGIKTRTFQTVLFEFQKIQNLYFLIIIFEYRFKSGLFVFRKISSRTLNHMFDLLDLRQNLLHLLLAHLDLSTDLLKSAIVLKMKSKLHRYV